MALQLNSYAKVSGILGTFNIVGAGANMSLKIYPSSVALPTLPPIFSSAPAGFLINYTNFTIGRSGSQIKLTVPPAGPVAAVATGTPNWFFLTNGVTGTAGVVIGDSIGLAGSAPIVTLSSMSLVSGTSYTLIDFTLTFV